MRTVTGIGWAPRWAKISNRKTNQTARTYSFIKFHSEKNIEDLDVSIKGHRNENEKFGSVVLCVCVCVSEKEMKRWEGGVQREGRGTKEGYIQRSEEQRWRWRQIYMERG